MELFRPVDPYSQHITLPLSSSAATRAGRSAYSGGQAAGVRGRRRAVLIDSPHRDDNLLGVRPPGPSPGDAVSIKSSKDKRPKRSPGETLTREGRSISAPPDERH